MLLFLYSHGGGLSHSHGGDLLFWWRGGGGLGYEPGPPGGGLGRGADLASGEGRGLSRVISEPFDHIPPSLSPGARLGGGGGLRGDVSSTYSVRTAVREPFSACLLPLPGRG